VACDDPSHTYYTPGTFAVSLTVKGPGSEGTMTRADYISVYAPAAAAFSATPTSGAPPLIVDFTNLSTGDYDECLWDFGDGGREANCGDPTHEYESEGDYTITLTVSGPGGEDTMIDEGCIQVASYHIFLPRIFGGS